MVSDKFRYQLRKEAKKWQNEGLIESDTYQKLATRYNLENLETVSNNTFLAVIITLGFTLLGLAVITFVAANWQMWSKPVKVLILVGFFIAINTTGFYLYREQSEDWKSRLGQGLLLLGGLSLGANIGLMSQIFHQTGTVYKLFLFWGFGVLLMAYALRLTSLGILALILIGISYFSNLSEIGYYGHSINELNTFIEKIALTPLLVILLFGYLAYWCSSRWLFGLAIILWLNIFIINTITFSAINPNFFPGLILACTATIPPAFLWAYQDDLGFLRNSLPQFAPISRKIAILQLGIIFYALSFNSWWDQNVRFRGILEWTMSRTEIFFSAIVIVFLLVSIWLWWKLGKSQRNNASWRVDRNTAVIGIMILTTGLLIWWDLRIHELGGLATFMFNLLLFLLAIGLIRQSLKFGQRLGYWGGIFLVSLQLLSRMLEYDTELLFKSIVLFLCGISVIFAGIWFENHLKKLSEVKTAEE